MKYLITLCLFIFLVDINLWSQIHPILVAADAQGEPISLAKRHAIAEDFRLKCNREEHHGKRWRRTNIFQQPGPIN